MKKNQLLDLHDDIDVNNKAHVSFSPRKKKASHIKSALLIFLFSLIKLLSFHYLPNQSESKANFADKYAVACLSSVRNSAERETLKRELTESGKEIIEISIEQMNHFAGNMLQLKNNDGDKFVVLSESAYNSLSESQISSLEKFNKLIVAPVPTIEKYGGGSVRCMIAEVF